jgi:hypothetical protein
MSADFRRYVPPPTHPKIAGLAALDARGYRERVLTVPWLAEWIARWRAASKQPFFGITTEGLKVQDLFALEDETAPVEAMAHAAEHLLRQATAEQRQRLCYPLNADEWRLWSNPEFYINETGIRLEEEPSLVDAVVGVVRASLSERGYRKFNDVRAMNAFLGELCNARGVMNGLSYNFSLYGRPSLSEPWGWQIFGHHLVFNCMVIGRQMVLSPCFLGAEPNLIDEGAGAGLRLFRDEEELGLTLMRSLTGPVREAAWVYRHMRDPAMPAGRFHRADQRQLGGAFQDNRIIPYEGVRVAAFSPPQRELLVKTAGAFLDILPPGPYRARLQSVEKHLDNTWFSWIGGFGEDDPFYYRIQSPVIMLEFDHHSGVFLTNSEAKKCHIHTIIRTPNGNDYGKDLLRQHYLAVHPQHSPGGC